MSDLLDLALKAHGGLDRWHEVKSLDVRVSLTGALYEQGLLQRLDYLAVGPAAHYCFDHANYKGIVFPTLRRVLRRPPSGPLVNGPTAVLIQITDVLLGEGDCG